MSGVKQRTVTLTEQEVNRLRRAAAQCSSLSRDKEILQRLNQAACDSVAAASRRIDSLNSSLQNMDRRLAAQSAQAKEETEKLRRKLTGAVQESNRRMAEMAREQERQMEQMDRQFTAAIRDTRTQMAQALESSSRQLRSEMAQMEGRMGEAIQDLQQQVTETANEVAAAHQGNQTLLDMAQEYWEVAGELIQDTQNYRHELLLPGGMAPVQALAGRAEEEINLTVGPLLENAPIAREHARAAYDAALEFHVQVLQAEQAWTLRYQETLQLLNAARVQLESNRRLNWKEEGCAGAVEVDVDFWSGGALEELAERLTQLEDYMHDAQRLSLEDLDNVCAAAAQISQEVDESGEFSILAMVSSQDRADLSDAIVQELEERWGLRLQDFGYQANDQRAALRVHLKNPVTGFEMVICETPSCDENGRPCNCLESHILDYGTNDLEAGEQMARAALNLVGSFGDCTDVQTQEGFESKPSTHREYADLQRWKQEQQAEVLRKPAAPREGGSGGEQARLA